MGEEREEKREAEREEKYIKGWNSVVDVYNAKAEAEIKHQVYMVTDGADWLEILPFSLVALFVVFYKYGKYCCGEQQIELDPDENGITEIPSDDEKKEEHSDSEQEINLSSLPSSRELVRSVSAPQLTNSLRRRRGRSQIPQNPDRAPVGSLRRTHSVPLNNESRESKSRARTANREPQHDTIGTCAGCNKSNGVWFCKGCNAVMYCSRECQKSHWKTHKPHCKKVQAKVVAPQAELECVD